MLNMSFLTAKSLYSVPSEEELRYLSDLGTVPSAEEFKQTIQLAKWTKALVLESVNKERSPGRRFHAYSELSRSPELNHNNVRSTAMKKISKAELWLRTFARYHPALATDV